MVDNASNQGQDNGGGGGGQYIIYKLIRTCPTLGLRLRFRYLGRDVTVTLPDGDGNNIPNI